MNFEKKKITTIFQVERAQRGIVFLDEIDKISGTQDMHFSNERKDVGGTAVQQVVENI